jgi:ATP-binding cassette subfamily F protein uup
VRELLEMRRARGERRGSEGTARIRIDEGRRSGKLVAELEDVTFAYQSRPLVRASRPRSCAATRSASSAPTGPARRRCSG